MSIDAFAAQVGTDVKSLRQKTGWRKIAPEAGWSGDTYISRRADKVRIIFDGISATATGASIALILPTGFRCSAPPTVSERFLLHNTSSAGRRGYVSTNALSVVAQTAGEPLYGSTEFFTEDIWPSTLPGNPA